MMDFFEIFSDYTLRNVALGSAILGIVSGALGTFAVLRKQSLLGDSISHAALPGVALAFMLTGSKTPIILLLGAAIAGWIGTLFILSIIRNTRLKEDSAQGIVLSSFFGVGLVLLTFIQKMPNAAQAGLDKFLFGQAATLMTEDIVTMAVLGVISLVFLGIFWKEFKIMTFDPEFGSSMGFPRKTLDIILTSIIVFAIVIGLQTVGVVLMSAMVVAPAAAARQWTNKLGKMVVLSAFFGAISGVTGAIISSLTEKMPTGPTIVICLSVVVLISIFLAPNRGLLWKFFLMQRNKKRFAAEKILLNLFRLAKKHNNYEHGHPISTLSLVSENAAGVKQGLESLQLKGLVQVDPNNCWSLTKEGYEHAQIKAMEVKA